MKTTRKYVPLFFVALVLPFLFGFTDLSDSHWAYGAVQQLVNDGSVSGFEDGSFRPNEPVTRAQMVKMVGCRLPEQRTDRGTDLKRFHWSFDYVMHSPLRLINGEAKPDEPMTREQAAVYLYDCFANGEKSDAPNIVFGDTLNRTEIGWVYEHGIMVGDDGINLRLSDTLTRAEAATLIVNSRSKLDATTDFSDNISGATLEKVFNGSYLFDVPYDEEKLLTNGEAARAAYRLSVNTLGGLWYENEAGFEHEYANDLKAMEFILGEDRISSEFASSPAKSEDVFAMLSYGLAFKADAAAFGYGFKDDYYKDAKIKNSAQNIGLTFAYKNGIRPYAGGILKSGSPITHKVMAGVLLQCDVMWGLGTSVSISGDGAEYVNEKMRFDNLPVNADNYASVYESVPNEAYEAEYVFAEGVSAADIAKPYVNYRFHWTVSNAYSAYLLNMAQSVSERCGACVRFVFYPHLIYDNGEKFILRVKAEITSMGSAKSAEELFDSLRVICGEARDGGTLWIEIPLDYMFFMQN